MKRLNRAKAMFLTMIGDFCYFYYDNKCYKCRQSLEIAQEYDIDFPYTLESDELVQYDRYAFMLTTYETRGRHYSCIAFKIFEFGEGWVKHVGNIPRFTRKQTVVGTMVSHFGKVYVLNRRELFVVKSVDPFELEKVQFQNQNLLIRDMVSMCG